MYKRQALRFSFQNRGIGELLKERLRRLGIPYLVGSVTFVPLYLIISARFIYGDINTEDSIGIVITFFHRRTLMVFNKYINLLFITYPNYWILIKQKRGF